MASNHQQQQIKVAPLPPSTANLQTNALNNNKPNTVPFGTVPMNANIGLASMLGLNNMTSNGNGTNAGTGILDTKREPLLDGILGPIGGSGKGNVLPNMLPNFDDPVEQSLASLCK